MNSILARTPRWSRSPNHAITAFLMALACLSVTSWAQPSDQAAPLGPLFSDSQISEYVREVFQDRDGTYWFGTNGDGVCRYDGTALTYLSVEEGFGGEAVRGIGQDKDGHLWFATNGGVSRYASGTFTNYTTANGLSHNQVWSLMVDSAGTIWAGTHEGVCRFDGTSFVPFPLPRIEVDDPLSRFSPKVAFAMFEDHAGNLWFGTDGEGAHRYDGESFTSYTTKEGLAGNLVRSIHGDRLGRIWIGTDGHGVSRFDGTTFTTFTSKDGLNNDRIFEILEDSAGNMWFSTLGAGACRYDGTSFTAFRENHVLLINGRPAHAHVQEFFEDRDGVLWLGCSGGLFRLEGESFVNVTRNGPWPKTEEARPGADAASPMTPFARMIGGEWRMGTVQFDTWRWGPGRHSMRAITRGSDGAGNPWSELLVVYWHPNHRQVRLLGMHPDIPGLGRGVMEGTVDFEDDTMKAVFDLHQPSHPGAPVRKLISQWIFDGPDRYHEALLEGNGLGEFEPLAEWDYVRSTTLTASPSLAGDEAPGPSANLVAFEPLLRGWATGRDWSSGEIVSIKSAFEWIPLLDVVEGRVTAKRNGGESAPGVDVYLYHHVGTGRLRCLALSEWGGVYEGDGVTLENGDLEWKLLGYEGDRVTPYIMRLDFGGDGAVRNRLWSVNGGQRTLVFDISHQPTRPAKD